MALDVALHASHGSTRSSKRDDDDDDGDGMVKLHLLG